MVCATVPVCRSLVGSVRNSHRCVHLLQFLAGYSGLSRIHMTCLVESYYHCVCVSSFGAKSVLSNAARSLVSVSSSMYCMCHSGLFRVTVHCTICFVAARAASILVAWVFSFLFGSGMVALHLLFAIFYVYPCVWSICETVVFFPAFCVPSFHFCPLGMFLCPFTLVIQFPCYQAEECDRVVPW